MSPECRSSVDGAETMTPYLLLMLSAFTAQALMFVPIVPLLIGSGALAAHGDMTFSWTLLALTLGVAAGDLLWYGIGRRRGRSILGRICRLAMEPSTCLRKTENLFGRYGAAALLFAKFVPGLSTVALPLAGIFRMRPARFVRYDVPGVLGWVGAYLAVGYFSAGAIKAVGSTVPVGWWIVIAGAVLLLYVGVKRLRQRRLLRRLRVGAVTVDQLRERLASQEAIAVIDLRHPLDFETDPYTIPTALYIPAEALAERHAEIPRDRDVVLYCTCPDEVTSAKEALRLRRRGITRVRPLRGGFAAWRAAGLPVERRGPVLPDDARILNAA
jgi:membrane protein DedA with SNARE-associated domain/rhodanese-related sulfurtransferase